MQLGTFNTKLNDRILFGDGESVVPMSFLYDHILKGRPASQVFVSKQDFESDEVTSYNNRFPEDKVTFKRKVNDVSLEWNIPEEYKSLDVVQYILDKLKQEDREMGLTEDALKLRYYRVKMELRLWEKRNLIDMLRTLIFIVNTFEEQDVVWGTGRGSSCASYILYLIGLHQVDCVEHKVDIGEFFR